ncbi:MAG: hypothetical protein AAGF97_14200 [Planctomycetota bacterium]
MVIRALLILLVFGCCSGTPAAADHQQVAYNFDDGVLFGWSAAVLSPGSPFGGQYLGSFASVDEVSLGILDALPGGDPPNSHPRIVSLQFDLIDFAPTFDDFAIRVNGEWFDLETEGTVMALGQHATARLDFPLRANLQGSADMLIGFQQTAGSGSWGIDNVVVDWSEVVPEPTWSVPLLLVLALLCRRRLQA